MLIIINRLGIIGIFYAFLPLIAGGSLGTLVGQVLKPSQHQSTNTALEERARRAGVPVKPKGSPAVAIAIMLVSLLGLHAVTWLVFRWLLRRRVGGVSESYWKVVYGAAYGLGLLFGIIFVATSKV